MKSTNKLCRLLSIALSALLLFSCIPLSASAATAAYTPENLFQTHLASKTGGIYYSWANGEVVDEGTGIFYSNTRFNGAGALDGSVDGDTTNNKDIWAFDYKTGNDNLILARYELDDIYYCGSLVMYAGDASKDSYFRVYASDTLNDLYTDSANAVDTAVICNGTAVTVEIKREIKYISIVYDANATIANYPEDVEDKSTIKDSRVAEFQLWSAEKTNAFVSENIFRTEHLESVNGGIYYGWANGEVVNEETGTYHENTRANAGGALDASIDGVLNTSKDMWGYDYSDATTDVNLLVARYHLDNSYYCGNLVLYAGSIAKNEIFRVYASTSLDDLYSDSANIVDTAVVCDGTAVTVAINREVKYISIVYDANATVANFTTVEEKNANKDAHIFEFQLWTAEKTDAFVSENIFRTEHLESVNGGIYYGWANGEVVNEETGTYHENTRANAGGALDASIDGVLNTSKDMWGYDYSDATTDVNLLVARYHLDNSYYCGNLVLYAGSIAKNEIFRVYASTSLDDLYSNPANTVNTAVVCDGTAITVAINRAIKYIAIVYDANATVANFTTVEEKNANKDAHIYEFELWTADPNATPDTPETPDESLKVLTLGNSFSEDTSEYVTKIAKACGYDLTFGYLKFPSCSISQHLTAATDNRAVFRFVVVDPAGNKTVIKEGTDNFESNDTTNCATIKDALEYADWDVVVFQNDSFSSCSASTFNDLSQLITYVKGFEPNAKLKIHEVWAWGVWNTGDLLKNFANIKANYEAAAKANDLEILPSGLAFEFAREELDSYIVLNRDDGYYQHANKYGKYLAGATYVAALFDTVIPEDTFTDNTDVNDQNFVTTLTAAANKAVKYYSSYGDVNNDGSINNDDMINLRKHLLSIDTTVEANLADANYNGAIDITDLIRIKKYLADNTVVLGPSK